jgi:hypothetical protein
MFTSSVAFTWKKPTTADALHWEERTFLGEEQKQTRLALVTPYTARFVEYAPLKDTLSLYRIFAETKPTLDGILAFANRYGTLRQEVECYALREGDGTRPGLQLVEPLSEWRWRILWLRDLVRLWDLVAAGNRKALAKVLQCRKPAGIISFAWSGELQQMVEEWANRNSAPRYPEILYRDHTLLDVVGAPTDWEILEVPNMDDLVQVGMVCILRSLALGMQKNVALHPRWNSSRQRVVLAETPLTLMGAICLQFALAVNEDTPSRRCEACGRWFEVAPDRSRADRTTCSGTCRTRLYRDRQEQARRLVTQGKKPKQIAKELGSDEATIRKWVTRKRE